MPKYKIDLEWSDWDERHGRHSREVAVERCGSQPRDNDHALRTDHLSRRSLARRRIYWSNDDGCFDVGVPELPVSR
jgi:hypothetical protein